MDNSLRINKRRTSPKILLIVSGQTRNFSDLLEEFEKRLLKFQDCIMLSFSIDFATEEIKERIRSKFKHVIFFEQDKIPGSYIEEYKIISSNLENAVKTNNLNKCLFPQTAFNFNLKEFLSLKMPAINSNLFEHLIENAAWSKKILDKHIHSGMRQWYKTLKGISNYQDNYSQYFQCKYFIRTRPDFIFNSTFSSILKRLRNLKNNEIIVQEDQFLAGKINDIDYLKNFCRSIYSQECSPFNKDQTVFFPGNYLNQSRNIINPHLLIFPRLIKDRNFKLKELRSLEFRKENIPNIHSLALNDTYFRSSKHSSNDATKYSCNTIKQLYYYLLKKGVYLKNFDNIGRLSAKRFVNNTIKFDLSHQENPQLERTINQQISPLKPPFDSYLLKDLKHFLLKQFNKEYIFLTNNNLLNDSTDLNSLCGKSVIIREA